MTTTLLNPNIKELIDVAYPENIPSHVIRLHLMENPYTLPPALQKNIIKNLESIPLNRYPDTAQKELKEKLR
jgi:histidinol-phosphate/aromatic aminotransferase/cobyric acid decarboxylase-like protein